MAKNKAPKPPEDQGEEEEVPLATALVNILQQWEEHGVPVFVVIDVEENAEFVGLLANGVKQLKRIADASEAIYGHLAGKKDKT